MSLSSNDSPPTVEKKVQNDGVELTDADIEASSVGVLREADKFRQGLHQRHIQMIALAGTIGTGLFLGSGKAIASAGPLGCFLGYSFIGLLAMTVVFAVGEVSIPDI